MDGRLDPAERERVLAVLAKSPEDYDSFVETVRALDDSGPLPIPAAGPARSRPLRLLFIPALAAAAIATILLLPVRSGSGSIAILAAEVDITTATRSGLAGWLGEGWDRTGWTVTRGPSSHLSLPARQFRLGARAVLYQVAVRAGDSTAARLLGAEMTELLTDLPGGAPVAALFAAGSVDDDQTGRPVTALEQLLSGESWFALGAAAEGLRLGLLSERPAPIALQELEQAAARVLSDSPERLTARLVTTLESGLPSDLGPARATLDSLFAAAGH